MHSPVGWSKLKVSNNMAQHRHIEVKHSENGHIFMTRTTYCATVFSPRTLDTPALKSCKSCAVL